MVLRVQQMRVLRAFDAAHELVRRGGDPGKMAEQIERRAFGGEHGAGGARYRHQRGLAATLDAVARMWLRSRCRARA